MRRYRILLTCPPYIYIATIGFFCSAPQMHIQGLSLYFVITLLLQFQPLSIRVAVRKLLPYIVCPGKSGEIYNNTFDIVTLVGINTKQCIRFSVAIFLTGLIQINCLFFLFQVIDHSHTSSRMFANKIT